MDAMNFLLTGPPRCGKTTLLRGILQDLEIPATGFYTEEVREGGQRVGFRLRTLDGNEGWLAHVNIGGPHRVGRYGVSLEALEDIGIASLRPAPPERFIVVDEIGKMECLSAVFCQSILEALDGPFVVLGTIAQEGKGLMLEIKRRPDVLLFRLDPLNRESLRGRILERVKQEINVSPETGGDG